MMRGVKTLALAALMLYPAVSSGFSKPSRWTANTSPVYPIVRMFGCPNHFATNFAGFDWLRIAYQVRNAANTWWIVTWALPRRAGRGADGAGRWP